MGFGRRWAAGACFGWLALASFPGSARALGDTYVLVQYDGAEVEDVAFGAGPQTAQASLSPPGVDVSATALAVPPDGSAAGGVGGAVQYDVAKGTTFSFDPSDRTGGAGEAFRSDIWLPVLESQPGEMVSLTLHVHATGSGETHANPDVLGALGSNILIEGGIFEAFGSGFVDAFTAEAQLGYLALPPVVGVPPDFVPPSFDGEWAGGGDWTVMTDSAGNLETFSYETWIDLGFQWPVGEALEITLFSQYFAGWCCGDPDLVLDDPIHASLSHALDYELEASNPNVQLLLVPEPAPGALVGLGLVGLAATARRRTERRS